MRILFLGDSLTYGFAMPREQAWPALCAGQAGAEVVNRAVNGNTTGGMLAVLSRELSVHSPDVVFLMGGTNDILYGGDLAGAKANMGGMVHLTAASGAVPLIGIPITPHRPVRQDWAILFPNDARDQLAEYIDWLRRFASTFRMPILDFAGEFPRRISWRSLPVDMCYLEDGLHPSQIGHEIMADIATDTILALEYTRSGMSP